MSGTSQHPALVPGDRAFEEIIARLTVGKRIHIGDDQAFFGIDDERVVVNRMKRLFLVGHTHQVTLVSVRGDRLVGWQSHTGRVPAGDVGILAKRREWCRNNAL